MKQYIFEINSYTYNWRTGNYTNITQINWMKVNLTSTYIRNYWEKDHNTTTDHDHDQCKVKIKEEEIFFSITAKTIELVKK